MKFYAYIGKENLDESPVGSDKQTLIELKTIRGCINRIEKSLKWSEYSLYTYTNLYDIKTYTKIK